MSQLIFQSNLGGQITLNGASTSSSYSLNVPATSGNLITSGHSGTITTTMIGNINGVSLSSVTVPSTFTFIGTGAVALPSGTTAQEPSSPIAGMIRYNTQTSYFEGYNGSIWGSIGGASAQGAVYENKQQITVNYTMTTGNNGESVGPITVLSGVVVNIPSGSRWVVL